MKKILTILSLSLLAALTLGAQTSYTEPYSQIRSLILLSEDDAENYRAIEKIPVYDFNEVQLSHNIIMDLREIRLPGRQEQVNNLIKASHEAGAKDVMIWDHCLYKLEYYPDKFKIQKDGETFIDLDNPKFWEWIKKDYRQMLDMVPDVQGLVLTFIETGARAEHQYSKTMTTASEKLAKVINTVCDVAIKERGLKIYLRPFAYCKADEEKIVGAFNLLTYRDRIVLEMKETPHDFFHTHPCNPLIGAIDMPTIVEWDLCGEFSGQTVIPNMVPQIFMKRWEELRQRPNVVGSASRCDRWGNTQIIGTPEEINVYALYRATKDPDVTVEQVVTDFITERYSKEALPFLKPVFESAYDIQHTTQYVLGLNMATHSRMSFENTSIYGRHCSGRWFDLDNGQIVHIGYGVDKDFHYWTDLVEHLAPVEDKIEYGTDETFVYEMSDILAKKWFTETEQMTYEYLTYVLKQYDYGEILIKGCAAQLEAAKPYLKLADYKQLSDLYERASMVNRMRRWAAVCYWGKRIQNRTDIAPVPGLDKEIAQAAKELANMIEEYETYSKPYPIGQWNWLEWDTAYAKEILDSVK